MLEPQFEYYAELSYEQLLATAQECLASLLDGATATSVDSDTVWRIIGATLSSDKRFSLEEYDFLCDLLHLESTYAEVETHLWQYTDATTTLRDAIAGKIPQNKLPDLASLVLCFAAADENIAEEEANAIVKMVNELLENRSK